MDQYLQIRSPDTPHVMLFHELPTSIKLYKNSPVPHLLNVLCLIPILWKINKAVSVGKCLNKINESMDNEYLLQYWVVWIQFTSSGKFEELNTLQNKLQNQTHTYIIYTFHKQMKTHVGWLLFVCTFNDFKLLKRQNASRFCIAESVTRH